MRNPIIRILTTGLTTLIISVIITQLILHGINNYRKHTLNKLEILFNNRNNFNVLFLGSSTTHLSVNPYIIDSVCGANSYNAGMDGSNLYEQKMIYDAYLENNQPPELLVITLDFTSIELKKKLFNPTHYFSFQKNNVIKNELNRFRDYPLPWFTLSFFGMICYDDYLKSIGIRNVSGKNISEIPEGDFEYKGFLSNTDSCIPDTLMKETYNKLIISPFSVNRFRQFAESCRATSTRLIFIYPPEYNHGFINNTPNSEYILSLFDYLAITHDVPFLRMDNLALCKDHRNFYNTGHLNKKGSFLYSRILANELKKYTEEFIQQ